MKNRLLIGASDKTPLFLHFLQQDFPRGLTLIDPDGSLAEAALDIIPERFTDDVNYFDPSDAIHVGSFNVFKRVKDKAKFVDDLCAFFDAMFPAGPQTLRRSDTRFVLETALTLLLDTPGVSFKAIKKVLRDHTFREECIDMCTNEMAEENWREIEQWSRTRTEDAIGEVTKNVSSLLLSPLMHRTLEGKPTFYLTKTNILIANLSRAKIGDKAAKLLGTLLISRARTPVYINQFNFFATDYLASLFSQGGYTIGLQFLSSVPSNIGDELLGFEDKHVFKTTEADAEQLKFYVGKPNASTLMDLRPDDKEKGVEAEFLPPQKIDLPEVRGRSRAVRKRSIACHTRKRDTPQ